MWKHRSRRMPRTGEAPPSARRHALEMIQRRVVWLPRRIRAGKLKRKGQRRRLCDLAMASDPAGMDGSLYAFASDLAALSAELEGAQARLRVCCEDYRSVIAWIQARVRRSDQDRAAAAGAKSKLAAGAQPRPEDKRAAKPPDGRSGKRSGGKPKSVVSSLDAILAKAARVVKDPEAVLRRQAEARKSQAKGRSKSKLRVSSKPGAVPPRSRAPQPAPPRPTPPRSIALGFPPRFQRVHRACTVALAGLERHAEHFPPDFHTTERPDGAGADDPAIAAHEARCIEVVRAHTRGSGAPLRGVPSSEKALASSHATDAADFEFIRRCLAESRLQATADAMRLRHLRAALAHARTRQELLLWYQMTFSMLANSCAAGKLVALVRKEAKAQES